MYRESLEDTISITGVELLDHGMHWTLAVHVSNDERTGIISRHREFSLNYAASMDIPGQMHVFSVCVQRVMGDVGHSPPTSHHVSRTAKCPIAHGAPGPKHRRRSRRR